MSSAEGILSLVRRTPVVRLPGSRADESAGHIALKLESLQRTGSFKLRGAAAKLASLGSVDILCTHVAPAVSSLARDVVGGKEKGSAAVLDYLLRVQPPFHYFGDIHQPQAISWRVGDTRCRNVGYFRATGKAVRHEP